MCINQNNVNEYFIKHFTPATLKTILVNFQQHRRLLRGIL